VIRKAIREILPYALGQSLNDPALLDELSQAGSDICRRSNPD
jgi:hypothetical protein